MGFGNIIGLFALLSIIPLIIFYLRRPKPLDKTIPSLMFFMKQMSSHRQNALFRKLLTNLLFLMQLLSLITLSFAAAYPFIDIPGKAAAQETALVIDMSASTQAAYGSGTRFEQEIASAKKELSGKISIILAENVPIVALEHGSAQEALKILSGLQPRDTASNIGDAMLLASDMLQNRRGRVVVLSDFITVEGPDPLVAQRALTAKGIEVNFVNVASVVENVGIVDLSLGKEQSKVFVKNFNSEAKNVKLDVVSGNVAKRQEKKILPNSIETFVFDTPKGTSSVELAEKDGFPADNKVHISAPESKKINVLLITNEKTSYVQKALEASPDIALTIDHPPIIPNLEAQVIVVHRVSTSFIVGGFYKDLRQRVSNGTALVITVQEDIAKFDKELLPVSIKKDGSSSTTVVEIVNQLTKDATFGVVSKYLVAEAEKDTLTLVAAEDESPMLLLKEYGDGKIVYYGFLDDYSEFKSTTSYPIFWNSLMAFLTNTESLQDFNYKTGKVSVISEQTVSTPYGDIKTSKLFFDKAGIYTIGEKKIAANLLSESESDVSSEPAVITEEKSLLIEKTDEKRRIQLEPVILVLASLLILSELIYIKARGDI